MYEKKDISICLCVNVSWLVSKLRYTKTLIWKFCKHIQSNSKRSIDYSISHYSWTLTNETDDSVNMTDTSPWRQLLQHTDSQYHMMKNAKTVEVSIMTDTKPRLNARTYHVVKKRTSTSKKCVGSRNTGVTKMERRIGPPKYVLPVRKTTRTTTSLAKKPSPVLKTPSTLQNSNKTSNKKLENNVASKNIQSMHPFRPSQSDLDEQVNDRAKQSLIVWHQRLNEYVHFCDVNGHGKHYLFLESIQFFILSNKYWHLHLFPILKGCVPQKYEKNNKLGTWVNKQRMERKIREDRGDKFGLSDWKISKLNEAGFVW